ncbi:hypothetical protein OFB78_30855, partial [Escherichia coli]|nr:hypothetical protein [Escherichia coli]
MKKIRNKKEKQFTSAHSTKIAPLTPLLCMCSMDKLFEQKRIEQAEILAKSQPNRTADIRLEFRP